MVRKAVASVRRQLVTGMTARSITERTVLIVVVNSFCRPRCFPGVV